MPQVSVIIPIYKVEQYLPECIESVLAQTFRDYELILVDDGSPDGCPAICDEYAKKDSRIRVVHKKNGGLSDARNAGLNVAVGTYIYFLDGDDSIMPDLLEKAVSQMNRGLDLIAFRFWNDDPDRHLTPGRQMKAGAYCLETPDERLSFFHKELLSGKIGWEAWSRMFRRDLIEQKAMRFADNRRIFAEDLYFSLCYCAHAVRIACIDECLYKYRQRDDSIMGVQRKTSNIGRINELCREILAYYRKFEECAVFADHFSLIHMQIIAGQFADQLWASNMDPADFQKLSVQTVEDWTFLENDVRQALNRKDLAKQVGSVSDMLKLKWYCDFLLGGSLVRFRLRCKLLKTVLHR